MTRFDVELDWFPGGIWPRLHIEVEHRATGTDLRFTDEPLPREVAFVGTTALSYSLAQDPEVSRAVADSLLRCLKTLGVGGTVSLLRVDTSVETGTRFGEIVGEVTGVLISDYLSGGAPRFEDTALATLDQYRY